MKREVCFLIGANHTVLWSDASTSPLALPDSRERWEAIWQRRADLVEIAHSHPLGPEQFSMEDITTMRALDAALGRGCRFSLVTPTQYLVRGQGDVAAVASPPPWVTALRVASGITTLLETRLAAWEAAGPSGDAEHRAKLETLKGALQAQLQERGRLDVLFVCTHNSRRSHMAQLIALASAQRRGLSNVRTFSGGTEVTAFDPRASAALERAGFVTVGAFSKKIDDPANPSADFVAVMTCSQADAACPVVPGATRRVTVPYEDPKVADGTPEETQRYDERVAQIGRDLVWVFSKLSPCEKRDEGT